MPKKKDYPKWFTPYGPPRHKPQPPSKTVQQFRKIGELTVDGYGQIALTDELRKAHTIIVGSESSQGYDGDACDIEVTLSFGSYETVDNPHYDNLLAHYKKDLAEYTTGQKEWAPLKEKWDAEVAVEEEARQKRQYEKLKKKYEGKAKN